MLYMVYMKVNFPATLQKDEIDRLKVEAKAHSQKLQRDGKWRHLWRVAGQYANFSVFEASGNDEIHEILMSVPIFPYTSIEVTPLAQHPSAISLD
ncbi:muconolactone delta-isomerase [Methylobacterium sp. J-030]|uniref:muconolactone Delta-isomerase family protein n=1 Tax=Methylobacterium sp. J-030 TaxID=2836627 RepID=UPI001FB9FC79|nr:muconolactone Delta-isomerase family protein [Methylobacterium sp. J-030]MCJ2070804.1 muconolactone delta-isomerase [Methylobacterium sp. J-030]